MNRFHWLLRRLRRMYWREIPHRIGAVLRMFAQSKGWFGATRVPSTIPYGRWGNAWCQRPQVVVDENFTLLAAQNIMAGKLAVFGQSVPMVDGQPDWNTDPVSGKRIPSTFGLYIDFRHLGEVDIKYLWEVNRHLWLVPLAQSYSLSGDDAYLKRLSVLLTSWLRACPYPRGANWSSPIEQGIRLVNWSLIWGLIGGSQSPMFEGESGQRLLRAWIDSIYQHICFISDNYSQYSSANNHLIGEVAGVFIATHTWDQWVPARSARRRAKLILEREAVRQFTPDGANFEQATGYHTFCLQFLVSAGLAGRANSDDFSAAYWHRIEAGMTFLAALMDSRGQLPGIGDSDDGEVWRLSHSVEFNRNASLLAIGATLFARRDLQAKVVSLGSRADAQVPWLLQAGPPAFDFRELKNLPVTFVSGGYRILGADLHSANEFRLVFDCGPLGCNRIAGHGHADALSVLVSVGGEPLLVDAGTYCYNAAPKLRHFFRGTHAHNTLVVDDLDQSEYGGSFLWLRDVNCTLVSESDGSLAARMVHASHDGYGRLPDPVIHHRRVTLVSDRIAVIEDWLECQLPHEVELLWHVAPRAELSRLVDDTARPNRWTLRRGQHAVEIEIEPVPRSRVVQGQESPPQGWVSSRFYERAAAPVLSTRGGLRPGEVWKTTIRSQAT